MSQLASILTRVAQSPNACLTEEEHELLALYGAAYKVVHERLQPDNCDNTGWPKLSARAQELLTWAAAQKPAMREVYERAVMDNTKRAVDRMENSRRGMRISQLYEEIPKPPL